MKLRSILACTCLLTAAWFAFAQTPATTGTGTTNYITRWVSATAQGNSKIYQSTSGWLGINTTTPKMTLDLSNGNFIARGIGNFTGGGNQASVFVGDTSHGVSAYRGNNAGFVGGTSLSAYQVANGLYLQDGTGYVGIGTTNPRYNLDVNSGYGSARAYQVFLRDQNGSNNCLLLYNYNGSLNWYSTTCN